MNYYFLILIFFLSNSFTFTQQINIKIENLNQEKAVLNFLSGERSELVDTIKVTSQGYFQFTLDQKHSGLYRLSFKNNTRIDFIYDNEDVEIITEVNNIFDSLKVIKSESNKIYYDFIRLNKSYKSKTELLQLVLAHYPKDDNYYQTTKEKLIQVQEEYLNFVNVTAQADPTSFISRYVRSSQLPVIDIGVPPDVQLNYFKTHALDNVNFYDDDLIYSDAFTNKTIEYLTYYRNPQLPLELLEKEFMLAVDSILNKAKVNEIVYQHIVEYLINGFREFGFEKVIDYIIDNYILKDNLCMNEKFESSLERRIEQTRNFKIGSVVPNIIITDSADARFSLNDLTSERILILFYASWCPHCKNLIQQLIELYQNQKEKNTEVLAVSIDTSKTDLINFLTLHNTNWINVADLKGWNGKAASDYFLYATPTMFLINKEKKIIAKPLTVDELKSWF